MPVASMQAWMRPGAYLASQASSSAKPAGVLANTLLRYLSPRTKAQSILALAISIPSEMLGESVMTCVLHLVNAGCRRCRAEETVRVFAWVKPAPGAGSTHRPSGPGRQRHPGACPERPGMIKIQGRHPFADDVGMGWVPLV